VRILFALVDRWMKVFACITDIIPVGGICWLESKLLPLKAWHRHSILKSKRRLLSDGILNQNMHALNSLHLYLSYIFFYIDQSHLVWITLWTYAQDKIMQTISAPSSSEIRASYISFSLWQWNKLFMLFKSHKQAQQVKPSYSNSPCLSL